jgi:hypothetical protein
MNKHECLSLLKIYRQVICLRVGLEVTCCAKLSNLAHIRSLAVKVCNYKTL